MNGHRKTKREAKETGGPQSAARARGGARVPKKATASHLENVALYYLGRFATSAANLRRVLMNRVERSARHHGSDRAEGAAMVEALIARYEQSGLLNDSTYAQARTRSLSRQGASRRAIRARLRAKGVAGEAIDEALGALEAETGAADQGLSAEARAALTLARRRRLGPYAAGKGGTAEERREARHKAMATLARAGFDIDLARTIAEAESPEALEERLAAG